MGTNLTPLKTTFAKFAQNLTFPCPCHMLPDDRSACETQVSQQGYLEVILFLNAVQISVHLYI